MKKLVSCFFVFVFTLGCLYSCKKNVVSEEHNETVTYTYKDGSTITKSYSKTAPKGDIENYKDEKVPKLSTFKAKRLLKKDLKKLNCQLTAKVRVGYYECNNYQERLTLYKLAVNNIIDLKCDEIKTDKGSTYWVTAELTSLGKNLIVNPKKTFPEDMIKDSEAKAFLTPKLDQDQWGVPYIDSNVNPSVVNAMKSFYSSLAEGKSARQSLKSANISCALELIDTLNYFGVKKLKVDPFTRDMQITQEMVDQMVIQRLPRLQNAYMVTIGDNDFLYLINDEKDVNIEDVAYIIPSEKMAYDRTICSQSREGNLFRLSHYPGRHCCGMAVHGSMRHIAPGRLSSGQSFGRGLARAFVGYHLFGNRGELFSRGFKQPIYSQCGI